LRFILPIFSRTPSSQKIRESTFKNVSTQKLYLKNAILSKKLTREYFRLDIKNVSTQIREYQSISIFHGDQLKVKFPGYFDSLNTHGCFVVITPKPRSLNPLWDDRKSTERLTVWQTD